MNALTGLERVAQSGALARERGGRPGPEAGRVRMTPPASTGSDGAAGRGAWRSARGMELRGGAAGARHPLWRVQRTESDGSQSWRSILGKRYIQRGEAAVEQRVGADDRHGCGKPAAKRSQLNPVFYAPWDLRK